jgi:hypothetical protein
VIGTIEAAKLVLVGCWWHDNRCTKNSGDVEVIYSRFTTSFHRKVITDMYLNIFDMFQGAKARLLFAAIMFPTPTTKHTTIDRALLINILCTVC